MRPTSRLRPARLTAGAIAALAVLFVSLGAPPAHAATPISCGGVVDGVSFVRGSITPTTSSLVTVHQTSKTYARVTLWKRNITAACQFSKVFVATDARIGYGGTVAGALRKQDTGTTPTGVYTMTRSFGVGSAPTHQLPWTTVATTDYWVEDNASPWYNTYRRSTQGGFRTGSAYSEHLVDYPTQYRYVVVINYNMPPNAVRFRGAGIFLHVKGKGATAGCVSISAAQMRTVLATVRSGDLIGIRGI